ncbi:hypothetical protein OIU85_017850 [Salix viminalis]|uniref:Uncharacterized protein n=1 Tax=Salix viminalis TaxID=40686 RepID=A0A9Q0S9K2_SALVM|nr:hypothetical protein OIU85_017850 [Salix viminalis]
MGSVGRGENRATFKLQEIGSEFRETNFQTHRFQRDRSRHLELEEKESAVVVSPDRLELAEKESGFLEMVAVRVAEEKGVVFCGREEEKKRRQPKGVEKKRRQKEKGVDVAWCRREEEKEEDKARMRR